VNTVHSSDYYHTDVTYLCSSIQHKNQQIPRCMHRQRDLFRTIIIDSNIYMVTFILKLNNSSKTSPNKLLIKVIYPDVICIFFNLTYLSFIYVLQSALYRSLLTHITALHDPLRYPSPSLMLISPLPIFTLSV